MIEVKSRPCSHGNLLSRGSLLECEASSWDRSSDYLASEGGGPNPKDAIEQLLSETRSDDWYPEHYIERRQSVYEWGASGATEIIVLGITSALAYDLLRASILALVEQIRGAGSEVFEERPLTSEEAIERARWRIESVYSVPREDLELQEVSESNGEWLAVFRVAGTEYRARLAIDGGYPSFIELGMKRLS